MECSDSSLRHRPHGLEARRLEALTRGRVERDRPRAVETAPTVTPDPRPPAPMLAPAR